MKPWYEIQNADSSTKERHAAIWVYEEIGENFWGEGLTAKQFVKDLSALDVDTIDLHVNSPGGNVFDGQAIFNALRQHPAVVNSYIDGLAASIASVVALAGDHVVMASNALFMFHDPFGMAMGDAAEMRQFADVLDKIGGSIAEVYVAKTGSEEADIRAAMSAETWLNADEAMAQGFVDEVASSVKVAAHFDLSRFHNAPTAALAIDTTDDPTAEPPVAPATAATAPERGRVSTLTATILHLQKKVIWK